LGEAGRQIAAVAATYQFSFFEHWPSDQVGHRGTLAEAVTHLEALDTVLGALMRAWDDQAGLLIITSDHGNIEAKDQRQHTTNLVPTILAGANHAALAGQFTDLTGIARLVRQHLALPATGDR
jgi:2,3-bisphosphoglycerate-independent phosphoglycerate mutase